MSLVTPKSPNASTPLPLISCHHQIAPRPARAPSCRRRRRRQGLSGEPPPRRHVHRRPFPDAPPRASAAQGFQAEGPYLCIMAMADSLQELVS
ncbi:hypothetical protein EJB05_29486, partial [Eragrostis curvula]